jgi:hypothetical protein
MLFTNPRAGRAIAEEIGSRYQLSSTRRIAASSDGQNDRSLAARKRIGVWGLFRRSPRAVRSKIASRYPNASRNS